MKKLVLSLLLLSACSSVKYENGIPNFAVVEPGIYRGGEPDANASRYLASVGVKSVIKLNEEADVGDWAGFDFYYLPITLKEQLFKVPDWKIRAAVARLKTGTFVHCEHGQDRTGLVVGCYRVWVQGWTKQKAQDEMMAHGFHKELHGLWEFWEHVQ